MQGEDDLRGLAKIMAFMRAVSILLVLMHLYWFCYGFFSERGWILEIINKILGNFNRTAGLFSHTLYTLCCFGNWVCIVFPEYATLEAIASRWDFPLYTHPCCRIHCPIDGGCLDAPPA